MTWASVGIGIAALVALAAVVGPFRSPTGTLVVHSPNPLQASAGDHWLGTDEVSNDHPVAISHASTVAPDPCSSIFRRAVHGDNRLGAVYLRRPGMGGCRRDDHHRLPDRRRRITHRSRAERGCGDAAAPLAQAVRRWGDVEVTPTRACRTPPPSGIEDHFCRRSMRLRISSMEARSLRTVRCRSPRLRRIRCGAPRRAGIFALNGTTPWKPLISRWSLPITATVVTNDLGSMRE